MPVSDVLRVSGPHAATILKVIPEAYVAESFEQAVTFSHETFAPIATIEGDVLRGPHLVAGGAKVESRGILATRREIKELRERVERDREMLARLAAEVASLDARIVEATSAIGLLQDEEHVQEKALVGARRAAGARSRRHAAAVAQDRRRRDGAASRRRGTSSARDASSGC